MKTTKLHDRIEKGLWFWKSMIFDQDSSTITRELAEYDVAKPYFMHFRLSFDVGSKKLSDMEAQNSKSYYKSYANSIWY